MQFKEFSTTNPINLFFVCLFYWRIDTALRDVSSTAVNELHDTRVHIRTEHVLGDVGAV